MIRFGLSPHSEVSIVWRRGFLLLCPLLLALFILTAAAWVDAAVFNGGGALWTGPKYGDEYNNMWSVAVGRGSGGLVLERFQPAEPPVPGPTEDREVRRPDGSLRRELTAEYQAWQKQWEGWSAEFLGFGARRGSWVDVRPDRPHPRFIGWGFEMTVPYWLVLAVTAPGSLVACLRARRAWATFLHRRRQSRLGVCPRCGYDLRATPTRCPECGWAAKSGEGPARSQPSHADGG